MGIPEQPRRRRLQCCVHKTEDTSQAIKDACRSIADNMKASCDVYINDCDWTCGGRRLSDDSGRRRLTLPVVDLKYRCNPLSGTAPNIAAVCETIDAKATCANYPDECEWSEAFNIDTTDNRRLLEAEPTEIPEVHAKMSDVTLDLEQGTASIPLRRRLHGHCAAKIEGSKYVAMCSGLDVMDLCVFYLSDCVWDEKAATGGPHATPMPTPTTATRRLTSTFERRPPMDVPTDVSWSSGDWGATVDINSGSCVPGNGNDSAEVGKMCMSITNPWSCMVYKKYNECRWDVVTRRKGSQRLAKATDSFST